MDAMNYNSRLKDCPHQKSASLYIVTYIKKHIPRNSYAKDLLYLWQHVPSARKHIPMETIYYNLHNDNFEIMIFECIKVCVRSETDH